MNNEKYISLEEIQKYLPKNKLGKEKYECIQSVPPRFRDDAFVCLEECNDFKTLDKAWGYFLDDTLNEMTLPEKVEYNFTRSYNFNIEKLALEIVKEIVYENEKKISDQTLEKECYLTVEGIKQDLKDEIKNELKRLNYEVI